MKGTLEKCMRLPSDLYKESSSLKNLARRYAVYFFTNDNCTEPSPPYHLEPLANIYNLGRIHFNDKFTSYKVVKYDVKSMLPSREEADDE